MVDMRGCRRRRAVLCHRAQRVAVPRVSEHWAQRVAIASADSQRCGILGLDHQQALIFDAVIGLDFLVMGLAGLFLSFLRSLFTTASPHVVDQPFPAGKAGHYAILLPPLVYRPHKVPDSS